MTLRNTALAMSIALPLAAWAADPNPCELVTSNEVASSVGAQPAPGVRSGPTIDEGLRAKAWTCEQQVDKGMLAIAVVEFASPDAAAQGMAAMLKAAKENPGALRFTPASGVGDQAVWGVSPEGAMWVALKGKHILNVTMAGTADPPRLREPLRRLTASALGRL
ncbi:MAG TPA: hypothetical protein VFO28_19090 [Burkholderiaceae bacterium]|nr:hypothetical protein [Burkholderiaceae bacterium]